MSEMAAVVLTLAYLAVVGLGIVATGLLGVFCAAFLRGIAEILR